MSTIEAVKIIDQRTKDIVYGYSRCVQQSFPADNIFYTISELIIHWILLYFHPQDAFDENHTHSTYRLNKDKLIVTKKKYSNEGCLFLTRRAKKGIHTWQFKLVRIDPSLYTMTIGIWKTKYQLDTSTAVRAVDKSHVYGWMLIDDANAYLVGESENKHDGNEKYCKSCKQGDIVEMTLDLNEFQLKYSVNGKDYGVAFDNIEETEYVGAVSMYEERDSVEILSYKVSY